MKIAYADPPYIGYSKYYRDDPNCAEVDHSELMKTMCNEYDAWALSCYTNSLKTILGYPSCPDDVRIGAWIKPFCSWKPSQRVVYAWEPVIFWKPRQKEGKEKAVRDWISENMTMQKGLMGAKPIKVCYWLFEVLGAETGDEFFDLFPGTGIVTRAWENWNKKMSTENLPLFETKE